MPGVRAGFNFSQITNTNTEPRLGYFVGITYAFKISERYKIQPEFNYSVEGVKGSRLYELPAYPDMNGNLVYPTERRELNGEIRYKSLSIINKYVLFPKLNLLGGASIGITSADDKFVANDTEIALIAGLDYTIIKGLAIDFRLKHGLTDLFSDDTDFADRYDAKGNSRSFVIQIGLAYTFDLSAKK